MNYKHPTHLIIFGVNKKKINKLHNHSQSVHERHGFPETSFSEITVTFPVQT